MHTLGLSPSKGSSSAAKLPPASARRAAATLRASFSSFTCAGRHASHYVGANKPAIAVRQYSTPHVNACAFIMHVKPPLCITNIAISLECRQHGRLIARASPVHGKHQFHLVLLGHLHGQACLQVSGASMVRIPW